MVTEHSIAVSLVGGTCSGLVCSILFQPLDYIKTQLQCNRLKSLRGLLHSTNGILHEGVIRGAWWNGLRPSLAKTIPGVTCYFLTLSQMQKLFGKDLGPLSAVLMGICARTTTVVLMQPLTLIKTRYECGKFSYTSISGAVHDIVMREKIQGLYRGLSATIIRDAPFSGIYLAFYLHMKSRAFSGSDSMLSTSISGLVAGSLASCITHPADVVKTRIQISGGAGSSTTPHMTVVNVAVRLYSEGKMSAFYAGLIPRLIRRTLVSSTAWVIYEEVRKREHLFP